MTIDEFKAVLAKVLQYEKTPCPFRGEAYAVDPASPLTPARRRSLEPTSKARKWHLKGVWMPEDARGRVGAQAEMLEENTSEEDDRRSMSTVEGSEYTTQAEEITVHNRGSTPELEKEVLYRLPMSLRSVTAPPKMTLNPPASTVATPEVGMETTDPVDCIDSVEDSIQDNISLASSIETFYSVEDTGTELPSSVPLAELVEFPDGDEPTITLLRPSLEPQHKRDSSDATLRSNESESTQDTAAAEASYTSSERPCTPALVEDSEDFADPPWSDVATPPDTLRLRRVPGISHQPSLSSMSSPVDVLCSPTKVLAKRPSMDLFKKTYALLLGPPAHLVALMLRIAARIAGGARVITSYDVGAKKERIPCAWESSGDDEDEWDEDDFSVPLRDVDSDSRKSTLAGELD